MRVAVLGWVCWGGCAGVGVLGWVCFPQELGWGLAMVPAAGLMAACWWTLRLRRGVAGEVSLSGMMRRLGMAHLAVMGGGVLLLGITLAPISTLRDDLRPFATEILQHTGAAPDLILYKLDERMWPFYLGLTCREVANLEELPATARWVMVKEKDVELRREEMGRRYGRLRQEIEIQEPVTGNAGGNGQSYRLLEFAGS